MMKCVTKERSAGAGPAERRPRRCPTPSPPRARRWTRASPLCRLVLELRVKIRVLGDHLLKQRPVNGIATRLVFDVAHLDEAVGALQDEVRLLARVDHGGLLAHSQGGVLH